MPHHLARVAALTMALLAGTARAEGIEPFVAPSLLLVTDTIPEDGVILFVSPSGWTGWELTLGDGAGGQVPGALETLGNLLIFRPGAPLVAGQPYRVTSTLYGTSSVTLTVVRANAAPFDMGLLLSFSEASQPLEEACCTIDLERGFIYTCRTVKATSAQALNVATRSVPDRIEAGQLLVSIDVDDTPGPLDYWRFLDGELVLPHTHQQLFTSAMEHCARLRVLDLRTGQESTGPAHCQSQPFAPAILTEAQLGALDLNWERCPVPPADRLGAYCDLNAQECQTSTCNYYGHLCRGEPVPGPDMNPWIVRPEIDASRPEVDAGAGEAAVLDAGEPVLPARERESGCSLHTDSRQGSSWLAALAPLVLALRRARPRARADRR